MKDKTTPEDLLHEDGENNAVRMFLAAYGCGSPSIKEMKNHLECCGFPFWPEWADKYEDTTHLTKGGAQDWIRHLFSLEPEAVRARACVELCAGSSDAVIKDITDALRAYEMSLGQYTLNIDTRCQKLLSMLEESKKVMDAAVLVEQQAAELQSLLHKAAICIQGYRQLYRSTDELLEAIDKVGVK